MPHSGGSGDEPLSVTERSLHLSLADFDQLPVAAAAFDLHGTLLAANPAFAHLVGRAPAAGDRVSSVVPALEAAWVTLVASLLRRERAVADIDLDHRSVRATAVLREHEGRRLVLLVLTELGERLRGTQRLESLGTVAGDLAHEFNNQLVGVIADAGLLREEDDLSEPARDAVLRIEAAARRMSQLSRQLLAFAGRGRFVTMLLDPNALLADARDRWDRLVPPGAELHLDITSEPVAIEADRGLLRQVIGDLLENAAEALNAQGGRIDVTSRSVSVSGLAYWQLEIRDNGAGIDKATLARIFDPFFSTKAEHRGLGLSAALGIVRRLGGDLVVDSQPGAGASFRVRLPIVPGAVAPRRKTTSKQPPLEKLTGLRILVADDEATVRATVQRMLERRGAIPTVAADGASAERLLRTHTFDAVLLDVMMPNLTGHQLVPIVRETQPNAPVILMSGYTDQAHGVEPPDFFLEKPFNASMLESALQSVLRNGNGNH